MKRVKDKMFIYALINPTDGRVFYIGQSKNVYVRVLEHINKSHLNKTPKDEILTSLMKAGLMPKYEVLEEIEVNLNDKASILNVSEREMYWIKLHSAEGWVSNKQLSPDLNINTNPYLTEIKCKYCERPTKVKNTNKQFCSSKCRVYFKREKDRGTIDLPKVGHTINMTSNAPPVVVTKRKQHNHTLTLTVSPNGLTRNPGESGIDFAIRKAEWEKNNLKK